MGNRPELGKALGESLGQRRARGARRGRADRGDLDSLPVHAVPLARSNLAGLDREVLPGAQHRADDDVLGREFDEGGQPDPACEPDDGGDRSVGHQPDRHAGESGRDGLIDPRCRRPEPGDGDFGGQHAERADDEDLGVLDFGGGRVGGFGDFDQDLGQPLDRLVAGRELVECRFHGFDAFTPWISVDGVFGRGPQVREQLREFLAGMAPVVGEIPHFVFIAVRPVRTRDIPEPLQAVGNIERHSRSALPADIRFVHAPQFFCGLQLTVVVRPEGVRDIADTLGEVLASGEVAVVVVAVGETAAVAVRAPWRAQAVQRVLQVAQNGSHPVAQLAHFPRRAFQLDGGYLELLRHIYPFHQRTEFDDGMNRMRRTGGREQIYVPLISAVAQRI
ncbi:hypothetical protein [Nocardia sp. NPDC050710]|uniref:hypothetical protein n=1 Tax=Nocardia sp. NPDC050710 TaxID=3157220 RepID=UPI00340855B9